jgi:hypothetical protein
MPVHIENLTSRVEFSGGGSPLSEEQLTRLVELVAARLAAAERAARATEAETAVYRSAVPPSGVR